jgi:3-deoxy-D-manno-octulosonic acid (KDO) 8-phosphate synthase
MKEDANELEINAVVEIDAKDINKVRNLSGQEELESKESLSLKVNLNLNLNIEKAKMSLKMIFKNSFPRADQFVWQSDRCFLGINTMMAR